MRGFGPTHAGITCSCGRLRWPAPVAWPVMKDSIALGVLVAIALGAVGCGSPRVVRGITSRADQVKFLYIEGGDTGVVKCELGPDGALSNCRPMTVALDD